MSSNKDTLEQTITEDEPRAHHYYFAHHILPMLFFSDPEDIIEALSASDDALDGMWRFVYDHLTTEELECQALPSTGLRFEAPITAHGWSGGIVHLPAPRAATEAFAIFLLIRTRKRFLGLKPYKEVIYFTLELGYNYESNQPCTFICNWEIDKEGMHHVNHGIGPGNIDEFIIAVKKLIEFTK